MEFRHFGQAGLELLTSGDSSALASQSAGITGVSHRAWPNSILKKQKTKNFDLQRPVISVFPSNPLPPISKACRETRAEKPGGFHFCDPSLLPPSQAILLPQPLKLIRLQA